MRLWDRIKSFFNKESEETDRVPEEENTLRTGELTATVEAVPIDEESDVQVEIVEMDDVDSIGTDEEDIEVEIIETEDNEAAEASDTVPTERNGKSFDDGLLLKASEDDIPMENQSRMTEEYKQWLAQQIDGENQQGDQENGEI